MFKDLIPNLVVLGLFLGFVVAPGVFPENFPLFVTQTYSGVVHGASLIFIVGAFLTYFLQSRAEQAKYVWDSRKNGITNKSLDSASALLAGVTSRKDDREALLQSLILLPSNNPLISAVVTCVERGYGKDVVQQSVAKLTEELRHHYEYRVRFWNQLAAVLPLLGMTGTIAGLMFMFQGGTGDDSVNLSALSTALLTTLYSSLITVLYTKMVFKVTSDQLSEIRLLASQVARDGQILVGIVGPHDLMQARAGLG